MGTIETELVPDEPVEEKTCSKCKQSKPRTDFNKNSSAKDGLQRYCRQCNSMYGRRYYQENSDGIKVQRKGVALEREHLKELRKIQANKQLEIDATNT